MSDTTISHGQHTNGGSPLAGHQPTAAPSAPGAAAPRTTARQTLKKAKRERLLAAYEDRREHLERHAHPLDPLSPAETQLAVRLVREHKRFASGMRFSMLMLVEPTRDQLHGQRRGRGLDRRAEVVLIDVPGRTSWRVLLNLTKAKVTWWREIEGHQPPIVTDEFIDVEVEAKFDGRVQEALRRRGLDLQQRNLVNVDPWSAGNFGEPEENDRRIARGLFNMRNHADDNAYAHPIDGLSVVYDLYGEEIIKVEDEEVRPVPSESSNYATRFQDRWRTDLKPLDIVQPEGPSFTVDGWRVQWQKWSLRVGFNQREGLTLHEIEYDDDGTVRPVMFRASVAEMTVPYGDVAYVQRRKNAFDAGEYGLGLQANSLELGCDCLGDIHYFDTTCIDTSGELDPKNNAICLHEEDAGILWKHWDLRTDKTEVRRSRRLVISFIATIGNYEYGFYWYLYQDGTIELEVKATGIVQTGALHDGETTKYGPSWDPTSTRPTTSTSSASASTRAWTVTTTRSPRWRPWRSRTPRRTRTATPSIRSGARSRPRPRRAGG